MGVFNPPVKHMSQRVLLHPKVRVENKHIRNHHLVDLGFTMVYRLVGARSLGPRASCFTYAYTAKQTGLVYL